MVNKSTNKRPSSVRWIVLILGILAAIGVTMGVFFSNHPTWIGEQPATADYLHRALGLISDMPHATAEMFYDAVENSIVFCVVWFFARKRWAVEHARFDAEHGIDHTEGEGAV